MVVLNDIHIDIMDYIAPAFCSDVQFRSMWAEFEWENKVCASMHAAQCALRAVGVGVGGVGGGGAGITTCARFTHPT